MTECRSMVALVKDLWEEYGEIASQVGCAAGAVVAAVASKGSVNPVEARMACLEKIDKIEEVAKKVEGVYAKVVGKHSWATFGPRALTEGRWHRGTIFGPGDRLFLTPVPVDADRVRVRLKERGGKGKVEIAICAISGDGDDDKLAEYCWNENRRERRDDSQTIDRSFGGVEGRWIALKLDGKSVANRFRYSVRIDY